MSLEHQCSKSRPRFPLRENTRSESTGMVKVGGRRSSGESGVFVGLPISERRRSVGDAIQTPDVIWEKAVELSKVRRDHIHKRPVGRIRTHTKMARKVTISKHTKKPDQVQRTLPSDIVFTAKLTCAEPGVHTPSASDTQEPSPISFSSRRAAATPVSDALSKRLVPNFAAVLAAQAQEKKTENSECIGGDCPTLNLSSPSTCASLGSELVLEARARKPWIASVQEARADSKNDTAMLELAKITAHFLPEPPGLWHDPLFGMASELNKWNNERGLHVAALIELRSEITRLGNLLSQQRAQFAEERNKHEDECELLRSSLQMMQVENMAVKQKMCANRRSPHSQTAGGYAPLIEDLMALVKELQSQLQTQCDAMSNFIHQLRIQTDVVGSPSTRGFANGLGTILSSFKALRVSMSRAVAIRVNQARSLQKLRAAVLKRDNHIEQMSGMLKKADIESTNARQAEHIASTRMAIQRNSRKTRNIRKPVWGEVGLLMQGIRVEHSIDMDPVMEPYILELAVVHPTPVTPPTFGNPDPLQIPKVSAQANVELQALLHARPGTAGSDVDWQESDSQASREAPPIHTPEEGQDHVSEATRSTPHSKPSSIPSSGRGWFSKFSKLQSAKKLFMRSASPGESPGSSVQSAEIQPKHAQIEEDEMEPESSDELEPRVENPSQEGFRAKAPNISIVTPEQVEQLTPKVRAMRRSGWMDDGPATGWQIQLRAVNYPEDVDKCNIDSIVSIGYGYASRIPWQTPSVEPHLCVTIFATRRTFDFLCADEGQAGTLVVALCRLCANIRGWPLVGSLSTHQKFLAAKGWCKVQTASRRQRKHWKCFLTSMLRDAGKKLDFERGQPESPVSSHLAAADYDPSFRSSLVRVLSPSGGTYTLD